MFLNKVETIILPPFPLLGKTAKLIEYVASREPTFKDISEFLSERFMVVSNIPMLSIDKCLSRKLTDLDILDHVIYEQYRHVQYAFITHGCDSSFELLINEFGLIFIEPGAKHVARSTMHSTVPRAIYHNQTIAFRPPRIAC